MWFERFVIIATSLARSFLPSAWSYYHPTRYDVGLFAGTIGMFVMNRCYHYDPDANNHSRAGVMALRIGAAGFVVLLLSALGVMHIVRRSRPGVNRS